MAKKIIGILTACLMAVCVFTPQVAVADRFGNIEYEPHEGISIVPSEDSKTGYAIRIDLSKYNLKGKHIVFDEHLNITSFDSFDDRTTASRGCHDDNAACWTSGLAMGDMQFTGVGTARGFWPGRNAFFAGDRPAEVEIMYNGTNLNFGGIPAWGTMTSYSGGADGIRVTRF